MPRRLEDKVAVITGAGSRGPGLGNGKAAAILFAREGARVLCVDLKAENAEETAKLIAQEGGEAAVFAADVSRKADCEAMVKATSSTTMSASSRARRSSRRRKRSGTRSWP